MVVSLSRRQPREKSERPCLEKHFWRSSSTTTWFASLDRRLSRLAPSATATRRCTTSRRLSISFSFTNSSPTLISHNRMTAYYREGPWNRFASSSSPPSSVPPIQPNSPNSRRAPTPAPSTQDNIKCSDCGDWVALLAMGEHHCAGTAWGKEGRKPDMRVDTGLRAGAGGSQASVRGYQDSGQWVAYAERRIF